MHRIVLEGIQTKSVIRALREILSVSVIMEIPRMSRFVFQVKVSRQFVFSRFVRKCKLKFDRTKFPNVMHRILLEGIQTKVFLTLRKYLSQQIIRLSRLFNPSIGFRSGIPKSKC